MRINEGFVVREICGKKVIIGEGLAAVDFGKLLEINETAAWLWDTAKKMGDFNIESLTDVLCEKFEVVRDEARQDITQLINEFRELGLVDDGQAV